MRAMIIIVVVSYPRDDVSVPTRFGVGRVRPIPRDDSGAKELLFAVVLFRTVFSNLHHFGHLTDDHDRTLRYYRNVLGGSVEESSTVDEKVDVTFVEWPQFRVEIVSRRERGTYLDELLDKLLDESPYHLAITVPDIDTAMAALEDDGIPMYNEEPVGGLGPYVRAFPEPSATPGLPIELIELEDR